MHTRIGKATVVTVVGLVAVAAVIGGLVVFAAHRAAVHPEFIPTSVKATEHWKPRPSYYCAGLGELASRDPGFIVTMVNAAPDAASHTAMLGLYRDVEHLNPSAADLVRVDASYTCAGSAS